MTYSYNLTIYKDGLVRDEILGDGNPLEEVGQLQAKVKEQAELIAKLVDVMEAAKFGQDNVSILIELDAHIKLAKQKETTNE